MNYKKYGLVIFSFVSATTLAAEERSNIEFAALPEAVRSTISHFIDDQKNISQIEKVTDDGYVKFEIKSTKTVNNKEFVDTDMTIAADGEIMTMAREVPAFNIPFPVMKKVNQRYPNLKVDEVENVQTRYFLLTGKTNDQPIKLKIYDDGDVQEIQSDRNHPPQSQKAQSPGNQGEQTQEKSTPPSDDSFHKIIPDEDDELQLEHSDYNFIPDQPE